ncbi:hypothetical protein HOG98_05670 [bacterium]|jgi:hypothetical protein|nr:hypothetical protein [bacterium]
MIHSILAGSFSHTQKIFNISTRAFSQLDKNLLRKDICVKLYNLKDVLDYFQPGEKSHNLARIAPVCRMILREGSSKVELTDRYMIGRDIYGIETCRQGTIGPAHESVNLFLNKFPELKQIFVRSKDNPNIYDIKC